MYSYCRMESRKRPGLQYDHKSMKQTELLENDFMQV